MMDRMLELLLQQPDVFVGNAGDEHRLAERGQFGRDFDNLVSGFAGAKNHFGVLRTMEHDLFYIGE